MKLSDGIEQAVHSVTMLASLEDGQVLSAAALATFHGVSPSYLLKHLQALSRARILATVPGPKGGYHMAKKPERVTLFDIVIAIEGSQPAFRCKEIRRNGPNPLPDKAFTAPCQINAAMLRAEQSYRNELRKVTIASLLEQLSEEDRDGAITRRACAFLEGHVRASKT
ncbi:MAG: RrF2 family transcriptional regulator [Cohaesibacteraceae bacterium]